MGVAVDSFLVLSMHMDKLVVYAGCGQSHVYFHSRKGVTSAFVMPMQARPVVNTRIIAIQAETSMTLQKQAAAKGAAMAASLLSKAKMIVDSDKPQSMQADTVI